MSNFILSPFFFFSSFFFFFHVLLTSSSCDACVCVLCCVHQRYDGPQYEQAEGCEIEWKAGQDPTVKITKKKQRKKTGNGKGQVRTITKSEDQPSFFTIFTPPTMPGSADPDDLSEELQEALFRDFEIGDMFKEKVTPHAVLWYTGEANDHQGLGDMDDDDMYGSDDEGTGGMLGGEDDDSEDPDYAPPPEGEQPAECKNQ